MKFPYACAKCGAEAVVHADGTIVRTCDHEGSTIIAERSAVLYGIGHTHALTLAERAQLAISKLVDFVLRR